MVVMMTLHDDDDDVDENDDDDDNDDDDNEINNFNNKNCIPSIKMNGSSSLFPINLNSHEWDLRR